jgi:hypothetical protein
VYYATKSRRWQLMQVFGQGAAVCGVNYRMVSHTDNSQIRYNRCDSDVIGLDNDTTT